MEWGEKRTKQTNANKEEAETSLFTGETRMWFGGNMLQSSFACFLTSPLPLYNELKTSFTGFFTPICHFITVSIMSEAFTIEPSYMFFFFFVKGVFTLC